MIRPLILISLCLSTLATAQSSTFIGNGGDTITLKVNTALQSLRDTLELWSEYDLGTVCTCQTDLNGSKNMRHSHYCSALKQLSEEKREYCKNFLATHRYALLDLTTPGKVKFNWQDEPLYVEDSDQEKKQVQALANRNTKTITFYKKDIASLSSVDLLALLTHELTHFVRIDKRVNFIDDNMKVGPFNQPEGGRALLDTLGAAVVTLNQEHFASDQADPANADHDVSENEGEDEPPPPPDYRGKNIFFGLGSDTRTFNINGFKGADLSPILMSETINGVQISLSYYANLWGIAIHHSEFSHFSNPISGVDLTYDISETDVQLLYRWFPTANAGTRFSNSFFTLGLGAYYSHHRYEISDDFLEISASDKPVSGLFSLQYKYPIIHWLWLTIYTDLSIQKVKFREIDYKHEFIMNSVVIGVDYGM